MSERLYRSLPEPIIEMLLRDGYVDQPNAIIESIEGSTGLPLFEPEEFAAIMALAEDIAAEAEAELLADYPHLYTKRNGNHPPDQLPESS